MIPFARMLSYGNIIPRESIVKIISNRDSWYVLLSTGDLYVRGYAYYNDGLERRWNDEWTLLRGDVLNFWIDSSGLYLMVQTVDLRVYHLGTRAYRTGVFGLSDLTFFSDSYFSTGTIKIRDAFAGSLSVGFIDSTGRFIVNGSQRGLNANTTPLSNWTVFGTSMIALGHSSTNWWSMNSVGTVFGGGQNISQIFSTTQPEDVFFTYPISIGTGSNTPQWGRLLSNYQFAVIFPSSTERQWMGRGFGNNGIFGNGSYATLTSTAMVSASWLDRTLIRRVADRTHNNNQSNLYYGDNGLYYTGVGTYRGVGSAAKINVPVKINVPFDSSLIEYIDVGSQSTYIYLSTGKVYMAGVMYTNGTDFVTNDTYVEVTDMYGIWAKNYTNETMDGGNI